MQILKLISPAIIPLVPIFVWEIWLRPIRERRNTAHVIYLELESNRGNLLTLNKLQSQLTDFIPPHISVDTQGFESLSEKLGALPPDSVARSLRVYNMTRRLNELASDCDRSLERLIDLSENSPEEIRVKKILRERITLLFSQLDDLLVAIDKILPELNKLSYPWWVLKKRLPMINDGLK